MRRILYAHLIGLVACLLCINMRLVLRWSDDAGDWYWPFCAARALVELRDPYQICDIIADGQLYPPNALPTALMLLTPLVSNILTSGSYSRNVLHRA